MRGRPPEVTVAAREAAVGEGRRERGCFRPRGRAPGGSVPGQPAGRPFVPRHAAARALGAAALPVLHAAASSERFGDWALRSFRGVAGVSR